MGAVGPAAQKAVDAERRRIARLDAATVLAEPRSLDEPHPDLGVVVAHGARQGRYTEHASIDGDEYETVCRVLWVPAGTHEVRWAANGRRSVIVERRSVVHAHPKWLYFHSPPQDRMVPPGHRCPQRSLAFDRGLLVGRGTAAGIDLGLGR